MGADAVGVLWETCRVEIQRLAKPKRGPQTTTCMYSRMSAYYPYNVRLLFPARAKVPLTQAEWLARNEGTDLRETPTPSCSLMPPITHTFCPRSTKHGAGRGQRPHHQDFLQYGGLAREGPTGDKTSPPSLRLSHQGLMYCPPLPSTRPLWLPARTYPSRP